MRFMVLVKASKETEAGVLPSTELLAAMGKYNEELVNAGVMVSGEGLQPSAKGARITFTGTKRIVTDGPFPETKEVIAGFWVWNVKSRAEAIEWAKRAPFTNGDELEIRQILEADDFGPQLTPELRANEERLRERTAERKQGMQFLFMVSADAAANGPPNPELMTAIQDLTEEMLRTGKMIQTGGMQGSGGGTFLNLAGGKVSRTDGPYAESKEVVGGYAILEAESRAEAIELGRRFLNIHAKILGPSCKLETEMREMYPAAGVNVKGPAR
jgi:hypothetical protein